MSRDTIRLPHDAYRLLQTLRAAGHSAYVVGGCVRDSLLGRLPGDWDICTSARPDEMKALFCSQRLILTGEKHGTVAVILHGKPYEMTTYRLDGSYRDHRHPDNVQFVDDLSSMAIPSGRFSQPGASSVRNRAIPKLTGTAISSAINEVTSVP